MTNPHFPDLAREFPDFDQATLPAIPNGFIDTSWHNNGAPSFENRDRRVSIWIDYEDEDMRFADDGGRFIVNLTDETGAFLTDEASLETSDWAEVESFLAANA